MKLKTKITTLTEHFQFPIEKSMMEAKSISQTYKYISIHFPGLLKAFQSNVAGVKIVSCAQSFRSINIRRVWRNQRGNQNPYIEEKQTTQWSKEKVQKDKQRSTKHTYKTKDRVTRTPLKTGGDSGAPEGWAVHAPLVTPVVLI